MTHIEWHTPRSSSNYRKMRACCKILVASAKHHYMESMACCPACCTCAHSGKTAVALPICGPLSAKRTDSRRRMWKTKAHGSQRSTNLWAGDTRLKIESEWPLQKHRHRHRNRNRNRKATGYWELGTATPIDFRVKTRWGLLLSLLPWRLRVSNGFLPAFCHMVRKNKQNITWNMPFKCMYIYYKNGSTFRAPNWTTNYLVTQIQQKTIQ